MSLEKQVINIVARNLEKSYQVTLGSKLIEDLGVDSFNTIMIMTDLEDEFSISLDERDFTGIEKVSDIVDYLRSKYPETFLLS
ncbi:MAG: acyl carrier protein [Bacillota bacterium]|jgi:acyl carrier protein